MISVRNLVLSGMIAMALLSRPASAAPPPRLQVSDDGRYLVTTDGQPFFWLGDTAWRFIEKASRVAADNHTSALRYFEKRSAQGFNVIQTVLVDIDIPSNAAGHAPFVDGDFGRPRVLSGPDNDFRDDVDWFVEQAGLNGLYLALLPTWNSSVSEDHPLVAHRRSLISTAISLARDTAAGRMSSGCWEAIRLRLATWAFPNVWR